jgi:hypothetical protein
MPYTLRTWVPRRPGQVRTLACLTILALTASCGSDRPAGPDASGGASDSLPPADSVKNPIDTIVDTLPPADSLPPVDTLRPEPPVDTLPPGPPPPVDSAPPHVPTHSGVPFGPFDLWHTSYSYPAYGPEPFTMSSNADAPDSLIIRINAARALDHQLILGMTSGEHVRYTTNGKFDMAKWKARQSRYNTPAIRAAVAAAVEDGTVLMADVMDEPNHKTWGGVVTKATLDELAAYVKSMFPTLPVGASIRWDWRPDERYKVLDFIVTQFVFRFGSVTEWRDQALEAAKQNGISLVFAFNPINGGTPIRGCPVPRTGGTGTYACRMTPEQIQEAGSALGLAGCALLIWRYDARLMTTANEKAFKELGSKLKTSRPRPCRRL